MSKVDTGTRVKAASGSLRERAKGRGRFDGIDPFALERLAFRLEFGGEKYGNFRNWEKGQPMSWFLDSLERHINDYKKGDRSEDHLGAAIWNLFCMVHQEELAKRGIYSRRELMLLFDLKNYLTGKMMWQEFAPENIKRWNELLHYRAAVQNGSAEGVSMSD